MNYFYILSTRNTFWLFWQHCGNNLATLWQPFGNTLGTLWQQFGNNVTATLTFIMMIPQINLLSRKNRANVQLMHETWNGNQNKPDGSFKNTFQPDLLILKIQRSFWGPFVHKLENVVWARKNFGGRGKSDIHIMSNNFFDWFRFHIFAWLGWNPDYTSVCKSYKIGFANDLIAKKDTAYFPIFESGLHY